MPILRPDLLQDIMEEKPLRIALLGKTGTGKSSLGNTLIEKPEFQVNSSASSGTSKCKAATKSNGEITVVDTPGFFDTREDEAEMKPQIIRCIIECSPGPHAFLILLKVEKFTEQDSQVVAKIKESFSEEAFKYAVLVFTHGDDLDEGKSIKDFVSGNKALKELSDKCGGRCHVVDNKYWKNNQQDPERNNQFQMRELMNTIKEMVRQNGGGCYTNEMLQEVERNIGIEEQRTGSRAEAKRIVSNKFLKMAAGIGTGVLLGALVGAAAAVVTITKLVFELTRLYIHSKRNPKLAEAVDIAVQAAAVGAAAVGVAAVGVAAVGPAAVGPAAVGAAVGKAAAVGAAAVQAAVGKAAAVGAAVGKTAVVRAAVVGAAVGGVAGYQEACEADSVMGAVVNTARRVLPIWANVKGTESKVQ